VSPLEPARVIEIVEETFGANEFPGDRWLQGTFEGCEPYEEIEPFRGRDWKSLDPEFLDQHYTALSFFSEAGFRYFLPAYLVADLRDALRTADPLFHLTHGFSDNAVQQQVGDRTFQIRFGRSQFVNPRRYGAMRTVDYARYRLSVFSREEAAAIVNYLECARELPNREFDRAAIDAALSSFWQERALNAPTADALRSHLAEQAQYMEALSRRHSDPSQ
jgi:Family of unknown function (DUF6714)